MSVSDAASRVDTQIKDDLDEHVETLRQAVQLRSDTFYYEGHPEIASFAKDCLQNLGCSEAQLVHTEGSPGVWGHYDAGAELTYVIYGMLDTIPVPNENDWGTPPFEGAIEHKDGFGKVLVGRMTNKIRLFALLNSLDSMKKAMGELPANFIFLWETEETQGSPHYYDMLEEFRPTIEEGDACFTPGFGQGRDGRVYGPLGFKSAIFFDIRVSGDSWGQGPQGKDIHGMANALVDSPPWRLIDVLSSLANKNGTEITIEGFEDQYTPPTPEEIDEVEAYIDALNGSEELWRKLGGLPGGDTVTKLKRDLHNDPMEAFLQYFYGVDSFNLQGLRSGFQGPAPDARRFRLSHESEAFLGMRLPRGYDPAKTEKQLRDHFATKGYKDVQLRNVTTHKWYQTERDSPLVQGIENMCQSHSTDLVLAPYSCGGLPITAFGNEFDMPVMRGFGLGYKGYDGPEEFLLLESTDKLSGLAEAELSLAEIILHSTKRMTT